MGSCVSQDPGPSPSPNSPRQPRRSGHSSSAAAASSDPRRARRYVRRSTSKEEIEEEGCDYARTEQSRSQSERERRKEREKRRNSSSSSRSHYDPSTAQTPRAPHKRSDSKPRPSSEKDRKRSGSTSRPHNKRGPANESSSASAAAPPSHHRTLSDDESPLAPPHSMVWQRRAALVTASSANSLQVDGEEWHRSMLDIREEHSIQAYDVDMSVQAPASRMERRDSFSLISALATEAHSPVAARSGRRGFRFPGSSSLPASPNPAHSAASTGTLAPLPSNPTILVVDEHPSTRQIITKWLGGPNSDKLLAGGRYTEISCATGGQAMSILQPPLSAPQHKVDVLVCDMSVQASEDQLLIDWVLTHPTLAHIPIIALVDSTFPSQGVERLMRRGCWDVLHKPLTRAVFLNALFIVLNTRRQQQFVERLRSKGDEYKAQCLGRAKLAKLGRQVSLGAPTPGLAPPSPTPPSSYVSSVQPIQVLLVESDPVVVDTLRGWLESANVKVQHVSSIAEAVAALKDSQQVALKAAANCSVFATAANNMPHTPSPGMFPLMPAMQRAITEPNQCVSRDCTTLTIPLTSQPSLPLSSRSETQKDDETSSTNSHKRSGLQRCPSGNTSDSTTSAASTSDGAPQTEKEEREPDLGRTGSLKPAPFTGLPLPPPSLPFNPVLSARCAAISPPSPLRALTLHRQNSASPSMAVPSLTSPCFFGIELMLVSHDLLVPPGLTMPEEIEEHSPTEKQETGSTWPAGVSDAAHAPPTAPPAAAPSASTTLTTSQMLADLSLHSMLGKRRQLPVVCICDSDGPSPLAMALLKRVALTLVAKPLQEGLVTKKMGRLLDLIDSNRQAVIMTRRLNMYRNMLQQIQPMGGGWDDLASGDSADSSPTVAHRHLDSRLPSHSKRRANPITLSPTLSAMQPRLSPAKSLRNVDSYQRTMTYSNKEPPPLLFPDEPPHARHTLRIDANL